MKGNYLWDKGPLFVDWELAIPELRVTILFRSVKSEKQDRKPLILIAFAGLRLKLMDIYVLTTLGLLTMLSWIPLKWMIVANE
jgi:hypothetical protein